MRFSIEDKAIQKAVVSGEPQELTKEQQLLRLGELLRLCVLGEQEWYVRILPIEEGKRVGECVKNARRDVRRIWRQAPDGSPADVHRVMTKRSEQRE